MKIEVALDSSVKETSVLIKSHPESDDVERIVKALQQVSVKHWESVIAYRGHEAVELKCAEVVSFFTAGKEVHLQTRTGTQWRVKCRIKDLAEKLNPQRFVQINQGQILNRAYIELLDLSISGTIKIYCKDGSVFFVSRRYLRAFRLALGM